MIDFGGPNLPNSLEKSNFYFLAKIAKVTKAFVLSRFQVFVVFAIFNL